jgi:hypothetical protein
VGEGERERERKNKIIRKKNKRSNKNGDYKCKTCKNASKKKSLRRNREINKRGK